MANNSIVVIDIGSGYIKAGFAGEGTPSVIMENIVGIEPSPNVTGYSKTKLVGDDVRDMKVLKILSPVQYGLIIHFEELIDVIKCVYNRLNIVSNNSSLIIVEAASTPMDKREKLVKLIFEKLLVENLCFIDSGKAALQALGIASGVAVQCGHGLTEIIPVYEGCTVFDNVLTLHFAGDDITANLVKLLQENGQSFNSKEDFYSARIMKQKFCRIRAIDEDISMNNNEKTTTEFKSSDYGFYVIGKEKIECGEPLFTPKYFNREGLPKMVVDCINTCDTDIRENLKNIVMMGGTTMMAGFCTRMERELSNEADLNIIVSENRNYLGFIGASKLGVSELVHKLWITKYEYDRRGPLIIRDKYF